MTIALVILGLLLALAGLLGCVFPLIPGPPLSFLALIILSLAKNWEPFSSTFLIIMAGLMILLAVSDYVIPAVGAKKYGASRAGVWGSIIGMLMGVFLFPPFGMLIGAFAGAVAGELLIGKKGKEPLRAAWGVFVGNIVGTGLKLAYGGITVFFCVRALF